jgi:hypothetical protein
MIVTLSLSPSLLSCRVGASQIYLHESDPPRATAEKKLFKNGAAVSILIFLRNNACYPIIFRTHSTNLLPSLETIYIYTRATTKHPTQTRAPFRCIIHTIKNPFFLFLPFIPSLHSSKYFMAIFQTTDSPKNKDPKNCGARRVGVPRANSCLLILPVRLHVLVCAQKFSPPSCTR